jgi:aspartyl-tRNA synthetase
MKQPPRANAYRDAWAGELRAGDTDRDVRVAGWVHRRRDHGGLIFIDLRDRSGILQLVFHPETSGGGFALAEALRPEHVLTARGKVVRRDGANVNPNIPTGDIEVQVIEAERLATAETPPFAIDEDVELDEMLRMRNRALDLRRQTMQDALVLRHRVVQTMRRELEARDFLEIETPILTRSTPEGARDFLVPNRREPGTWYALPQSPQLFKQLLMIAGYERYYQIARCFRDEDTRADRQAEFTQLDVEMAFVTEDDVIETHEAVMSAVFELAPDLGLPAPPWPRMAYAEAIARFGSDRPDMRFGLEIRDVSDQVRGAQFKIFQSVLDGGGVVRAINAGKVELSRSELEGLNEVVQRHGGKAVAWVFVETEGWRSPIAKFFNPDRIAAVNNVVAASEGDLILFVADDEKVAAGALGGLRVELGERLGLIPDNRHEILWIVDFPAFESTDDGAWTSIHHPFSAPLGDLSGDPGALSSRNYDLILDGTELGGGSIRINEMHVQQRVFEILGMSEEEAQARFGFLLDALRHGAPPHGGIAFGLDRIVAIMGGRDSIRDVMAFPKTASGLDPLTGAPAPVDERQLRELRLKPV